MTPGGLFMLLLVLVALLIVVTRLWWAVRQEREVVSPDDRSPTLEQADVRAQDAQFPAALGGLPPN